MMKLTDLQLRLQNCIEKIVEEIDWKKIHKAMVCVDWTWATCGGTPTVDELKQRAREQLEEVAIQALCNKENYTLSCGGIETSARFYEDDDESGWTLECKFVLDSWYDEV